jgi:cytochrome c biogenesis protein CcdA
MSGADLALALAAGMVAAINPCGFALLPAYLSFLLIDSGGGRSRAVSRALARAAAMTAGFVVVFGLFGLVVSPLAASITEHLPWVTIVIGLVLAALGAWLLAAREITVPVPKLRRAPAVTGSMLSMALFGAAYAIASLGCTIAPFLAVVVTSFRAGDAVAGTSLFLAYALGMGLVVGTVAVAVALARSSLVNRLRRAAPVISRAAGGLLVIAGAYVAYYGWYEVRSYRGDIGPDPVVDGFGRVQSAVANWVDGLGVRAVAVTFVALVAIAALAELIRRRRRRARVAR